jgi:hypothetical protein
MSMTAERVSIDDVLEQNPIVLADNSINSLQGADWYGRAYNNQRYEQLCADDMVKVIENLRFSLTLWGHPRIHTTTKIVGEAEVYRDLLTDKQDFLLRVRNHRGKKSRGTKRHDKNVDEQARMNQDLLSRIVLLQKTVAKQSAKARIQSLEWPIVSELEAYITRLGKALGAKIDYNAAHGAYWEKRQDSGADEQLVAVALYLSIFDQMPTAILTRDSDLKRLTALSAYYLSLADASNAGIIGRALQTNPVRVYFLESQNEATLDMDTSTNDLVTTYVNRYPAGDQLQAIHAGANALITPWNIREYTEPVVQVLSYQPPRVQQTPAETMFKRLLRNIAHRIGWK